GCENEDRCRKEKSTLHKVIKYHSDPELRVKPSAFLIQAHVVGNVAIKCRTATAIGFPICVSRSPIAAMSAAPIACLRSYRNGCRAKRSSLSRRHCVSSALRPNWVSQKCGSRAANPSRAGMWSTLLVRYRKFPESEAWVFPRMERCSRAKLQLAKQWQWLYARPACSRSTSHSIRCIG